MNLNQTLIAQIADVVKTRKKVDKIILFGSRATNNARRTSDIDLAVFGKDLSDGDVNLIRFDLEEEVKTPLKFDVVHFETLTKEIKPVISIKNVKRKIFIKRSRKIITIYWMNFKRQFYQ